jgi:uncharacterized protein
MGQSWRHLLFAHWPADPGALRRVVPPQLHLDLYEGQAWVGVTPFRVEGFRLRGTPPAPLLSRFLEVNVRTYVHYDGLPGIYFLSLDTDSRFAVAGARRTYRLPYFHSRQTLTETAGGCRFRSERAAADEPAAELDCTFCPSGGCFKADPGTLAYFLAERYCLYTLAGGVVQRGEIHHPPWPLQAAKAIVTHNTMASGHGLELAGEPVAHYARLQDVVLWTIEPAARAESPGYVPSSPGTDPGSRVD